MNNKLKADEEMPLNLEKEEAVNTSETDDINMFIRKTQLQNRVLKKITEALKQAAEGETDDNTLNLNP